MLSYPIDEAEELLASKLAVAKQSLTNCEEDLDFLREQITVRLQGSRCISKNASDGVLDYGGSYSSSL
jgi:Prefoldin subunit